MSHFSSRLFTADVILVTSVRKKENTEKVDTAAVSCVDDFCGPVLMKLKEMPVSHHGVKKGPNKAPVSGSQAAGELLSPLYHSN